MPIITKEEAHRKYGKMPSVIMIFNPRRSESSETSPKALKEEEPLVSTTRLYEKIAAKVEAAKPGSAKTHSKKSSK